MGIREQKRLQYPNQDLEWGLVFPQKSYPEPTKRNLFAHDIKEPWIIHLDPLFKGHFIPQTETTPQIQRVEYGWQGETGKTRLVIERDLTNPQPVFSVSVTYATSEQVFIQNIAALSLRVESSDETDPNSHRVRFYDSLEKDARSVLDVYRDGTVGQFLHP